MIAKTLKLSPTTDGVHDRNTTLLPVISGNDGGVAVGVVRLVGL